MLVTNSILMKLGFIQAINLFVIIIVRILLLWYLILSYGFIIITE